MTGARRTLCVTALCVAALRTAAVVPPRIDAGQLMATVSMLSSAQFEGRRTGTAGAVKARQWIAARFKQAGLVPEDADFLQSFTLASRSNGPRVEGANVIGLCKGTAGTAKAIVISAHYDHLGIRGGVVYPGADDNASGVAVLLAMAEHCVRSPFRHEALFVAFDAEELGLQGAKAFFAKRPMAKDRIALDVNLDMVSRNDKRELFAAGTYLWPELKPPLEDVAKRAPIQLLFGHDKPKAVAGPVDDWTNQSDHGPFNAAGIPFVYFGVEDHADYHKPSDTADKINLPFFHAAAETILEAVLALDAAVN